MGNDTTWAGMDSTRPCEPSQYRSISQRPGVGVLEAADAHRLGPAHLHEQAVLDVEVRRRDRIG